MMLKWNKQKKMKTTINCASAYDWMAAVIGIYQLSEETQISF